RDHEQREQEPNAARRVRSAVSWRGCVPLVHAPDVTAPREAPIPSPSQSERSTLTSISRESTAESAEDTEISALSALSAVLPPLTSRGGLQYDSLRSPSP